jgi:hypothetical protein
MSSDSYHPAPKNPLRGVSIFGNLQKNSAMVGEILFRRRKGMEGKIRFTPKQINKALRLLRDLPVKDGRKNIQETLRLLEQGMRDALEKGYSRGEIRQRIAEAEVIISATTLKGFLVGEQKDAGQNPDAEAVSGPEENDRHRGEKTVKDLGKSSRGTG